jgi:hypothetical protein
MNPGQPEPDTLAKGIRFGCGFVAGIMLVASGGLWFHAARGEYILAGLIAAGIVCGMLAMRYGEKFWDVLGRAVRNWWW